MSPCVFHKMRAFNDGFIISPSGEKNSERELGMTWTEGERAPGWKSAVPAGRLEEKKKEKNARQKGEISASKEPTADVLLAIGV